jgi:transcriptional regulator with XRE-family HTH domain
MAAHDDPVIRGQRIGQRLLLAAVDDVREERLRGGLSLDAIAATLGWSRAKVRRIERGDLSTTVFDLCRLCVAVGLDPSIRVYPGPTVLRDAGQVRLLERFRMRVHPAWDWATEVPFPSPGDPRAWDGFLRRASTRIGIEAESRLRDAQATARRLAIKQRDGGVDRIILLLAETRANSAALAAGREYLRARFPLDTRAVLRALGDGRDPGANGIVVL